ncbi:hypothetical protein ERO13_D13G006900v2 [Gossypium hirsutum]|uniref:Uncharacterized protein LOC107940481 n=1 Tax=Gossypium hirsutum TaxID=3635 RepID=A0A1U8MRG4_GOSHI|nr:uncharacterized protein LOC107940481 [Gossypium hirsutum]XP_016729400.1 uncharacterized protein LOC107940481 [Gossypium hirsutum]KAG4109769.1 hypothetical protein ERO13_D13G006900v2 [Gossypium hirsutum]KAG4109770.1 hypothetical protein ERO13_D13G006900v2 [Gossypium hirsutum]
MVVTTLLSPCNSILVRGFPIRENESSSPPLFLSVRDRFLNRNKRLSRGGLLVQLNATEGSADSSKSEESIPSWAKPDSDEPPPWAQGEGKSSTAQQSFEVPFFVYLLASAVTAIAAVGSIFEYINQRPVFGVLNSDSIFYAPLLGFFAFSGIPTSAFLWFKSVQAANKEAEEQDRRDGFL